MYSVFLLFSTFCHFYNLSITRGKILKIRADYRSKYAKYYKRLMPYDPPKSLEDVFHGGMKEFDIDKLIHFSIGALLHDIGKMDNIGYFEGTSSYNRKLVVQHAPVSYNMIVKAMEFDPEVMLLAALHHEYYEDSSGYGISKILYPSIFKKHKTPKYCLTYNSEDLKSGYAMAYVPVKIFEIIDVFDALTDKNRKYRDKEFAIDEALEIMKNDFIDKHLRLDPILFALFLDYIKYFSFLKDDSLLARLTIP
jgi:putative nucleotidyltransferase with HDIG domain